MSDTTDDTESSRPNTKSLVGIAAVACVACCIGPILAVLGAIAALSVVSTIFIGTAGLLIAAVAAAAFIVVRRRRQVDASCAVIADQVPVELTPEPAVNRRLRRAAAALFVVAAALFVVGVSLESYSHSETGEAVHDETAEAAGHDEATESPEHDVPAEEAAGDAPVPAEPEPEHDDNERVLGVDIESPAAVTAAVIVSLALAFGLWLRNRRWLALVSVGFAVVFAVFDVAEIRHQLDESRSGLAVLAAVVAGAHLAAAATAGLTTRAAGPP